MKAFFCLSLLIVLICVGCTSEDKRFDALIGKSRSDVHAELGEPWSQASFQGTETWAYPEKRPNVAPIGDQNESNPMRAMMNSAKMIEQEMKALKGVVRYLEFNQDGIVVSWEKKF